MKEITEAYGGTPTLSSPLLRLPTPAPLRCWNHRQSQYTAATVVYGLDKKVTSMELLMSPFSQSKLFDTHLRDEDFNNHFVTCLVQDFKWVCQASFLQPQTSIEIDSLFMRALISTPRLLVSCMLRGTAKPSSAALELVKMSFPLIVKLVSDFRLQGTQQEYQPWWGCCLCIQAAILSANTQEKTQSVPLLYRNRWRCHDHSLQAEHHSTNEKNLLWQLTLCLHSSLACCSRLYTLTKWAVPD